MMATACIKLVSFSDLALSSVDKDVFPEKSEYICCL